MDGLPCVALSPRLRSFGAAGSDGPSCGELACSVELACAAAAEEGDELVRALSCEKKSLNCLEVVLQQLCGAANGREQADIGREND